MSDFDDKDFEMDQLAGEVTSPEVVEVTPPAVVVEPEAPVDEYQATINRLTEYTKTNTTWLCIPEKNEKGVVALREAKLHDCNADFFFEWLLYAWPPAAEMKHKASDYEKIEHRESAFASVCAVHKLCRQDPKLSAAK